MFKTDANTENECIYVTIVYLYMYFWKKRFLDERFRYRSFTFHALSGKISDQEVPTITNTCGTRDAFALHRVVMTVVTPIIVIILLVVLCVLVILARLRLLLMITINSVINPSFNRQRYPNEPSDLFYFI